MSTSRSSQVPGCTVDLGLQYITTTPELQEQHKDIYTPLIKENLIEPLRATILGYKSSRTNVTHYVTPQGSSSVVKYFFNQATDEIHFNTFLETIQKVDSKIEAVSREGKKEIFDIVVLSMPAAQAKDLFERSMGDTLQMSREISNEIIMAARVQYSGRYALAMYFDKPFERPFDVKYIDNDSVVRYVSFDNVKRNRPDEPTGVCVHTTTDYFSLFDEEDASTAGIEMGILKKMRDLFPSWPLPTETKLQKWRFSQVSTPHEDKLGYMKYNVKPLALCVGDSYVPQSNFDNCIYSAKQSVDLLVDEIRS